MLVVTADLMQCSREVRSIINMYLTRWVRYTTAYNTSIPHIDYFGDKTPAQTHRVTIYIYPQDIPVTHNTIHLRLWGEVGRTPSHHWDQPTLSQRNLVWQTERRFLSQSISRHYSFSQGRCQLPECIHTRKKCCTDGTLLRTSAGWTLRICSKQLAGAVECDTAEVCVIYTAHPYS